MRDVRFILGAAALAGLLGAAACDARRDEHEALGATKAQRQPEPVATPLPESARAGELEVVATFTGPMPTGVSVSRAGRVFVNFPRWGDPVDFTVAEVRGSEHVAFPSADLNAFGKKPDGDVLVSVQSVVVDPADRLWLLDTGTVEMGPVKPGAAKLVGVDLATNAVTKKIVFPPDVALENTYLNDVRFDLRRGAEGMAFVTDSSMKGPNGIVVVDLASGRSWRRLNDHASTKAEPGFVPFVEGRPVMKRKPGEPPSHLAIGSDGIALSQDGERLYYCPLASRTLYSVAVDALVDPAKTEADVAATVQSHGAKGASDGLEFDAEGRLYATNYEQNAILRGPPGGPYETLVSDPRALWPDTMSIGHDGWLYFTANQLHRQKDYQGGNDLRVKPYSVLRVKVDAKPVALGR